MYEDDDYLDVGLLDFGDVYDRGYGQALVDADRMMNTHEDDYVLAEEIIYYD